MKNLICALSILLTFDSYSQTADTLDLKVFIEKITNDSTSNFYYPKLLDKIKNLPTDISTEDCYYLYYGQIFQDNFKPLSFLANPERPNFDKAIVNGNCKKALEYGVTILSRNPVNLTVLLHVCNCMKEKNYSDTTFYFAQRFNNLITAILSSGDGQSLKTAIKIVDMEDDYVLKGVLGFLGGKEYLEIESNRAYSVWMINGQKLYFEDVMNLE